MSIPKEPRQLMINLMYLVLTAMLALNVSAEIINAFFALNKGIKESSAIVETTNVNIVKGIKTSVDAQPKYAEWLDVANKAKKISDDFEVYMNGVTNELVEAAGGKDEHHTDGRPKKYKDKDVTTNLFTLEGKGRGAEVEKKITETRSALLALLKDPKDKAAMEKQLPLMVDEVPEDAKGKSWVDLKFKQMPVAAVMPTLSKIIADANTSEASILNYCLDKASGKLEVKFDGFKVAIAPKKAYLTRGDKFEAEVYMAAYSKSNANNVSINVNGSGLPMKDGVAIYSTGPQNDLGEKTVSASATIKNPMTGETQTVKQDFKYEVGEKSVTVSAEKMNVFYIGVDNPVAVSAAGIPTSQLKVSMSGGDIRRGSDGNYVVTCSRPGKATVTVSGGGMTANKEFRVKPIPDPIAKINVGSDDQSKGAAVPAALMANMSGVIAELKNFDFDAKCSIQSYVLLRIPRRDDIQQANVSGTFNGDAQRLVSQAKPGDSYQFQNVKARCPGDVAGRTINSMSFVIR
jgi:gliding motility-associated protein GldM